MAAKAKIQSTLTDRYQTTVPEPVRRALGLSKRDKLEFDIRSDGQVVIARARPHTKEDPVLGKFLAFLADDMRRHPQRIQALDSKLLARIHALVGDVEVDLNAPLPADDE